MSLVPGRQFTSREDPVQLAPTLIRNCGLNPEAVQQIARLCANEELAFAEAALRLGLITQADIDAAQSASRTGASSSAATAAPASTLLVAHDPYHPHSERIRALRAAVLLRQPNNAPNVMAVISQHPGEGRSQLAAELAISCAQLGQSTLLIDADLRKPRLHELFGTDNQIGLANALAQPQPPHLRGVQGLPQLSLLTAGDLPQNAQELLASDALPLLLAGWRQRYRHIIFDTPPVVSHSSALAVVTHAGAVLGIARLNRTPIADWKQLVTRVNSTRARLLGAVLNRF